MMITIKTLIEISSYINYDKPVKIKLENFYGKDRAFVAMWWKITPKEYHHLSYCAINKRMWKIYKYNPEYMLNVLAHEIGHHYQPFGLCASENEYFAQTWAIKRFIELKEWEAALYSLHSFKRWRDYDWNSRCRIYRMAIEKALKNGQWHKLLNKVAKNIR